MGSTKNKKKNNNKNVVDSKFKPKKDSGTQKEVKAVGDDYIISGRVKEISCSDLIVKCFNSWYKNQNMYIIMAKPDNDIILKDYLIPTGEDAFVTLLTSLQDTYTIYTFGLSVFIDGNVMYVMSRLGNNKIDFLNEYTYKFVVVSQAHEAIGGTYPVILDDEKKTVSITVDKSNVKYIGNLTDSLPSNITFNKESSTTDASKVPSLSQTVVVDPQTQDTTDKKKDNDAQDENEEAKPYEMISIYLPLSHITFVPGDKIELEDYSDVTYKWKGVIRRWTATQTGESRSVYLVASGYKTNNDTLLGNLDLKEAIIDNNVDNIFNSVDSALDTIKELHEMNSDIAKDLIKNSPKNLKNQYKKLIGNIYDHTQNVYNDIYDRVKQEHPDWLGNINEGVNIGLALAESPTVRNLLDKGGVRLGGLLDMNISAMIDTMSNATSKKFDNTDLSNNATKVEEKPTSPELPSYGEWYYWSDGFDKYINPVMIKDIAEINPNSYYYKLLSAGIRNFAVRHAILRTEGLKSITLFDNGNEVTDKYIKEKYNVSDFRTLPEAIVRQFEPEPSFVHTCIVYISKILCYDMNTQVPMLRRNKLLKSSIDGLMSKLRSIYYTTLPEAKNIPTDDIDYSKMDLGNKPNVLNDRIFMAILNNIIDNIDYALHINNPSKLPVTDNEYKEYTYIGEGR